MSSTSWLTDETIHDADASARVTPLGRFDSLAPDMLSADLEHPLPGTVGGQIFSATDFRNRLKLDAVPTKLFFVVNHVVSYCTALAHNLSLDADCHPLFK